MQSFRGPRSLPIRLYFLAQRQRYYHIAGIRMWWAADVVGFVRRRLQIVSESARKRLKGWWSRRHDNRQAESPEDFEQSISLVIDRYVPKPYIGRVVLFRTAQFQTGRFRDPELGWGKLVRGGLEVYELPGDHMGVFEEPVHRKAGPGIGPVFAACGGYEGLSSS